MNLQSEMKRYSDPKFKDGYRQGIKAAASYLEMWDSTVAAVTNGYRISDMVLHKFNQGKKPRKMRAKQRSTS